jgi:hypothetical protein
MRYIALALGLCFVSGSVLTPLEAASKSRPVKPHVVKPKKNKIKARKASRPKVQSHPRAH